MHIHRLVAEGELCRDARLERPSATSVETSRSRTPRTDVFSSMTDCVGRRNLKHRIKRARLQQMTAVRHDANGDSLLLRRTGLAQISRGAGLDQRQDVLPGVRPGRSVRHLSP
jgi:hypothetical protein